MIDYKGLDKHYARREPPATPKRADQSPVSIFMLPILQAETTTLHCMFCGHPIIEVRNGIAYVSPYPPHDIGKVSSDQIICKRCKQRYIKIV